MRYRWQAWINKETRNIERLVSCQSKPSKWMRFAPGLTYISETCLAPICLYHLNLLTQHCNHWVCKAILKWPEISLNNWMQVYWTNEYISDLRNIFKKNNKNYEWNKQSVRHEAFSAIPPTWKRTPFWTWRKKRKACQTRKQREARLFWAWSQSSHIAPISH